ncbi:Translation initiation inhibitor [uncultured Gammaproteobacteria bacterium]
MNSNVSKWSSGIPGAEEFFVVVRPESGGTFAEQLVRVFSGYQAALKEHGLDLATGLTLNVFLSDAANQEEVLRHHWAFVAVVEAGVAVTVVQQPPVGGKIALLGYHVRRPAGTATRTAVVVNGAKKQAMGVIVTTDAYQFHYQRNLLAEGMVGAGDQTTHLMGVPGCCVQSNGVNLTDVVRTWIYISNIDLNYLAISKARNRVFDRFGISKETGFPASTGIDGRSSDHRDIVLLDVLAVKGLKTGQSRAMCAPKNMNPTMEYGVAFERGRELVFGDRRHLYISGTASINHKGEVLYPGDVSRQAERAIENVAALLEASGAELSDMRYVIVYLRDVADASVVEAAFAASRLGGVPRVMVFGPVCRPGWLVELEGVAIDGKGEADFAPF